MRYISDNQPALNAADASYVARTGVPGVPISGCGSCGNGLGAVVPGGLASKTGQIIGVLAGVLLVRRFASKSVGAMLVGAVGGYIVGSAVDSARASGTTTTVQQSGGTVQQ